jgi:hypothetical protein
VARKVPFLTLKPLSAALKLPSGQLPRNGADRCDGVRECGLLQVLVLANPFGSAMVRFISGASQMAQTAPWMTTGFGPVLLNQILKSSFSR